MSFGDYAFAGPAIDRADALRDDPEALLSHWPDGRVIVLEQDGTAWADASGQIRGVRGRALGDAPGTAIFLGLQGGTAWFTADATRLGVPNPHGTTELRKAAAAGDLLADVYAYARGMLFWQSRTRHCGVCGGPVEFRRAGFIGHCAQCGTDHYPRTDPAIIVAVSDGERLLLGRQANWPARRYSVIAGFVEPGETFEQTVVREVFEETRVRARDPLYLGAQPWPFPGGLMVGFTADAEPDPPTVDGELEAAAWFTRDEVGDALSRDSTAEAGLLLPPRLSIARSLIAHWHAAPARRPR